jgi:2-isopropylmalate synthase
MGKHSGRNALTTRLTQLGFELSNQEVDDVFKRFKALADKKKGITDEDLLALVGDEVHQPAEIWKLIDLQVCEGGVGEGEGDGAGHGGLEAD